MFCITLILNWIFDRFNFPQIMSLLSTINTIVIDTYICTVNNDQIMSVRLYEQYLTKIIIIKVSY